MSAETTDVVAEPHFQIDSENHAGWVVVSALAFMAYAIMAVAAKLISRSRLKALKSFDYLLILSIVFAIANTALVVRACRSALGQHRESVTSGSYTSFAKDLYIASILTILAHTAAKTSAIDFVLAINAGRRIKLACWLLYGVIIAWMFYSIFLIAFQCGLPQPWMGDQCLDLSHIWISINVVSIFTDVALVAIPTCMLWRIHTSNETKARVIALFASRIVVPIVMILQTAHWANLDWNDYSWTVVKPTILAQCTMGLSIITACVPSLKNVVDMFWSGASHFAIPRQYENDFSNASSGNYGIRSIVPSRFRFHKSGNRTSAEKSNAPSQTRPEPPTTTQQSLNMARKIKGDERNLARSDSQVSLTQNENVIMRTVEYDVFPDQDSTPTDTHGTRHHVPS